ncbi:MAG: aminoacyl-tRNA hydrolase [Deltaproteobacteria bacterium HGW-Deltaproteobacteria-15]|jgi:PTH1 family peptidyl-tRNA hydrolase|nr:MAG: aminoacyl-tRNA hydrolase [Deltaproteobacteria bacterium HGW-Deltaproteobacteria-15]
MIAGLGNPGPEYRKTRHNMGFRVIEQWAESLGIALRSRRFHSKSGRALMEGRGIILLCPQTYMNRSGMAVKACADYFGVETGNMLVVHDDIDLPLGRVKVVRSGGAGGHKGIQSIIDYMGTNGFARVKMGVGRPRSLQPVDEFVLKPFSSEEDTVVEEVVRLAVRACEEFVLMGLEHAMGNVNWQHLDQKEGEH